MWDMWFKGTPWREMDKVLQEMSGIFGEGFPGYARRSMGADFPRVNMWGNEDQLFLTAQLPGINPQDLSIEARDNTLTIKGKHLILGEGEVSAYHRQERSVGEFKRILRMPYRIDAAKVEAKYEKGVLEIILPRSPQDKPKKIAVSVS